MFFVNQYDQMDCGPACLSMISKYYGKNVSIDYFRKISFSNKNGVSLDGIVNAANIVGFETYPVSASLKELLENKNDFPSILHWNKNHFVVLYKISKNLFTKRNIFHIADPAFGILKIDEEKFKESWIEDDKGTVLFLAPTDHFNQFEEKIKNESYLKHFLTYLKPHQQKVGILLLALLIGTLINFFPPFLTQKLIDDGVNLKNFNVVILILIAQISLFLGSLFFQVLRNWLTLNIGTQLSITIISEFLKKLFKLPISFFETKNAGDFNQRIVDNERIEKFLTSNAIITFFSAVTFIIFFAILYYYNFIILIVYFVLTLISVLWSYYWLLKLKKLDYFKFQNKSKHQDSIFEIINGVTEMKLNQMEDIKISSWVNIQKELFRTNLRILKVNQFQISGFEFINQLKNIIVTYLAATLVIEQKITLGVMMSISFIIGQMNSPITQLIDFFRSLQDAKLSMLRLNEIQNQDEEENEKMLGLESNIKNKLGIFFKNVSFQYEGPQSPYVLKDINLFIPDGKITAVVGASGSGKTTLMKMLLKFYEPVKGEIKFNHLNLREVSPTDLRKNCGVVMQDGFIFSDTIERNIATSDEKIDYEKLNKALKTANIMSFVEELPLGLNTKIGASGNGISGGQKQRILIARAVYKNPHFILFDEATSALDAENEKIIHDNLKSFFKGKTVIIVAHRLSTVKNADQIIVLKNGEIVEQGNHQELVSKKADYFNLVKNQLELGN